MTGLYLFAAAAGVPLVAWFLLSGSEEGDVGAEGIGGIMLRLLPLSTLAMGAAAFGICGLLLELSGTTPGIALAGAVLAAVVAGTLNSTAFAYLRRSDSSTTVDDARLLGAIGRVVLPVGAAHRGRIAVDVAGQQIYLSARALSESELEVGASVLVVDVSNGVAEVTRLDPELA